MIVWDASRPDPKPEDLSLRLQRTGVTDEVQNPVQDIFKEVNTIQTSTYPVLRQF